MHNQTARMDASNGMSQREGECGLNGGPAANFFSLGPYSRLIPTCLSDGHSVELCNFNTPCLFTYSTSYSIYVLNHPASASVRPLTLTNTETQWCRHACVQRLAEDHRHLPLPRMRTLTQTWQQAIGCEPLMLWELRWHLNSSDKLESNEQGFTNISFSLRLDYNRLSAFSPCR